MQSTGQTSTHEASLTPLQGSVITKVIPYLSAKSFGVVDQISVAMIPQNKPTATYIIERNITPKQTVGQTHSQIGNLFCQGIVYDILYLTFSGEQRGSDGT